MKIELSLLLWVFGNVRLTWRLQLLLLLLYCAAAALYATFDKSDAVSSLERGRPEVDEGPLGALCNWKGTCNRHHPPSQRAEHCCCHSRTHTERKTRRIVFLEITIWIYLIPINKPVDKKMYQLINQMITNHSPIYWFQTKNTIN